MCRSSLSFFCFFLCVSFLRKPGCEGGAVFVVGPSPTHVVNRRQSAAAQASVWVVGCRPREHVSSLAAMHAALAAGLWEGEGGAGAKICAASSDA